jgi:hypothetical protein
MLDVLDGRMSFVISTFVFFILLLLLLLRFPLYGDPQVLV